MMNKKAISAWCLSDWACSPWPVVVKTFVFATYFSSIFVPGESGTVLWCNMLTISGLFIALSSPFIGILVDQKSSERFWFCIYTLLLSTICALLWFAHPTIMSTTSVLILLGLGTVCFELTTVFYNSILTRISPSSHLGRISGWGRALGFLGGLACLIIALKVLIEPTNPPFSLNVELSEHIRIIGPMLSIWVILFSLPAFFLIPNTSSGAHQTHEKLSTRFKAAFKGYLSLLSFLKQRPNLGRFLFCQMLYMDGLNTLFATAGIFAMHLFNLDMTEVLTFAICCNLSAALGSLCFSWVDDWIGPKNLIQLSICLFSLFGLGILLAHTKITFYFFAFCSSLFLGPLQSASRTYLLHISDQKEINTSISISALSGKITAFLGPFLVGTFTAFSGSERVGMFAILIFFAAAFILSLKLDQTKSQQQTIGDEVLT